MALADEPVGGEGVPAGGASAPVGDVERDGVAEDVVLGLRGGDVLGGPPDHRAELDLPVRAVPSPRDDHLVVVADHRAARRLQEEVGDAPVLAPRPPRRGPLLLAAGLVDVAVEVDGGVQDLAGVHDRGEGPHVGEVVDVRRARRAVDEVPRGEVVDDLVEAELHAVLVAPDQVQHVAGHGEARVGRVAFEGAVGRADVDDEGVPQHEPDPRLAVDLEGADLERLRDLPARRRLGGEGGGGGEGGERGEGGEGGEGGDRRVESHGVSPC